MVIAHNLVANNATRMFGINNGKIQTSIEKLSSGYKINRAADDAAGLAISEKMRTQIRGLKRASLNAQDGISLIQTAEGALNEVHEMLHRMNELATQAANDTNTKTDRSQIQKEIDQLKSEIDDVSQKTNFNTKQILAGINTYDDTGNKGAVVPGDPGKLSYHTAKQKLDGYIDGVSYNEGEGTLNVVLNTFGNVQNFGDLWGGFLSGVVPGYDDAKGNNTKYDYMGLDYYPNGNSKTLRYMFDIKSVDGTSNYYTATEMLDFMRLTGADSFANEHVTSLDEVFDRIVSGNPVDIKSVETTVKNGRNTLEIHAWSDVNDPVQYMLQVGALRGQGIEISIEHMNARRLGITGARVDDFESAGAAMKSIQDAIDIVSDVRASLGAQQNRLEHTVKNLDNVMENTAASESRIRDTDMAKEMVEFTKQQILSQASNAMIANARQMAEGVLALLQ